MTSQSLKVLTQLIEQSSQPAFLINLKNNRLITNNIHCLEILKLKNDSVAENTLFLQIHQRASLLANKDLTFFNYEIFHEDRILLVMGEVRDQYLIIYLQEKIIYNMPSDNVINILDSLGAQVYCKDLNYNYTYANKKVGELFGQDHKILIGTSDENNFDQVSVRKIREEIDTIAKGEVKKIGKEETIFIKNINEPKTFLSVKKPLYGKHKKIIGMFGISTDISQYKETEKKLNTILDNVPVYIYIKDLDQRFTYVNKMARTLFDRPIEEIIGKSAGDLIGKSKSKEYDHLDHQLLKTKKTVEGIEKLSLGDKTLHYWTVKAPLFDDEGNLTSLIGMSTDITKNVELEKGYKEANKALKNKIEEITKLQETLWEQATQDPLTQLFNRRYFNENSNTEIQKSKRSKKPLALLLLDADYFKRINDQFGHDIGDQVLIKVAKIMIGECRRTDIVCRYGGEEFVILMPDANEKIAFDRAEKIRLRYQKEVSEFLKTPSSISIGIAMWNSNIKTIEELTKAADNAMYQAKENGRNQVVVYNAKSD